MTVEETLRQTLLADSNVNALLGTRIYPLLIPQDATLPALAYNKYLGVMQFTHGGAMKPEVAHIQLTCVARTYNEAKQIQEAIRGAIDGKRVNGMVIFVTNTRDDFARVGEESVVRLDIRVYFE
ncbi:MAG: DUF3168 domain-containing protein [Candidatus Methanomethylicaceae archaeon]